MKEEPRDLYTQSTPRAFATRIRALRRARGWTLLDIEKESKGVITAVSMGAYERGARSLSLRKCIEIATLFGQPLSAILDQNSIEPKQLIEERQKLRLIVDIRALYKNSLPEGNLSLDFLRAYVKEIAHRRNDWNGEVISLRESDLETLSIALTMSSENLYRWLTHNSLLLVASS